MFWRHLIFKTTNIWHSTVNLIYNKNFANLAWRHIITRSRKKNICVSSNWSYPCQKPLTPKCLWDFSLTQKSLWDLSVKIGSWPCFPYSFHFSSFFELRHYKVCSLLEITVIWHTTMCACIIINLQSDLQFPWCSIIWLISWYIYYAIHCIVIISHINFFRVNLFSSTDRPWTFSKGYMKHGYFFLWLRKITKCKVLFLWCKLCPDMLAVLAHLILILYSRQLPENWLCRLYHNPWFGCRRLWHILQSRFCGSG